MNWVRWSMGEASLHGMGTSLVPGQCFGCHPCPWTKLLPMCPDRTTSPPNKRMQPTHQPVIKFACANLPPVWRAADAWRLAARGVTRRARIVMLVGSLGLGGLWGVAFAFWTGRPWLFAVVAGLSLSGILQLVRKR